jgi:hypothetical protein
VSHCLQHLSIYPPPTSVCMAGAMQFSRGSSEAPILARVHRPLAPHPRRCILRPCCPSTPRLPPPTPSYPRLPPPTPRPPPAASAQDWRGAGVWPDGEARGRHRGLGCASRDLGCGVWGVVRGVWGVGCGVWGVGGDACYVAPKIPVGWAWTGAGGWSRSPLRPLGAQRVVIVCADVRRRRSAVVA